MRHEVTVRFAHGEEVVLHPADALPLDDARRWLDQEFIRLDCEPMRASGKVSKLKVGVAGSGDVQTADLKADQVSVSIAGSGDVTVHADKTLDVSIAGSGDVIYSGDPAVKSQVAGSGSISRRK